MARPWKDKFRTAFRGLWRALCSERSFAVHLPMAVAVVVGALALRVTLVEACILGLCIGQVLAAETFNTAIEYLSREISPEETPRLADALDMASGAVLALAIVSALVGGAIFLHRAGQLAGLS